MSNKDRVWAAIRGEECGNPAIQIDFTPAAEIKIAQSLGIDTTSLHDACQNSIRYVNSLGNIEEYFNDNIPLDDRHEIALRNGYARFDTENGIVYDRFGVGWNYHSEGISTVVHPLENESSYSAYRWPKADSEMLVLGRKMIEMHGQNDFMLGFQHIGLFERGWALRGYENFLCDLMLEPDFSEELLDHILEYKLQEAAFYVEAGVDAVRIGDDWGLQNSLQMDPSIWRNLFKPRYEKLYSFYRSHGLPIFQHSCGAILDIVPDLIEIGLNVLHPIQPLSIHLEALSRIADGKITFWGGIDTQKLLPNDTPQQVYEQSLSVAKLLGKNHRYIFAPSQEIMSDVPVENVQALLRAAHDIHKTK